MPSNRALNQIQEMQADYLEKRFDKFDKAVDEKLAYKINWLAEEVERLAELLGDPEQALEDEKKAFRRVAGNLLKEIKEATSNYTADHQKALKVRKQNRWLLLFILILFGFMIRGMYLAGATNVFFFF